MGGYKYHAFISYPRVGGVARWVNDYFAPLLEEELLEACTPETVPRIFLDSQIETGADWPEELARALNASRCLIPVWTSSYFRSSWCMSELETMLHREERMGTGPDSPQRSLVVPVVYRDGELFPDFARRRQHLDFRKWATPYEYFPKSPDYIEFAREVGRLACTVAELAEQAPPWSADWPVLRPLTPEISMTPLPRLVP